MRPHVWTIFLLSLALLGGCEGFDIFNTYYDEDEKPVSYKAKSVHTPPASIETLTVMNWNIKFGGGRLDFFFDCHGDRVLMEKEEVYAHLQGIAHKINQVDPDVLFLQEVDVLSKRSAYVDMAQWLLDHTELNYALYGSHWKADFIPSDGLGRMDNGNLILSKYPIEDGKRIDLPLIGEQDALTQYFYLKRNIVEARIDIPGKDLYVLATHLSAYSQDGTKKKQLDQLLAKMNEHNAAGHLFVMAGDLNTLPPGSLKLKDFSDSVCPKEGPFDADDFSEETTWLAPFYEGYQSAVPLPDYQENNAAYFTHTTSKEGFWNRKLDYLFTNGTFVPGSDITHQGSWAGGVNTMELSDHAPVTVVLEVGP